jgi:serine/threonine-protein kinase SRPK3
MDNLKAEEIYLSNDSDYINNTLETSPDISSILSNSITKKSYDSYTETKKTASNSRESTESIESTESENSNISTDSSEHIDKTKGNNNLGIILNGKYILIEKIGYGTFSTVWLAYKFDDNTNKHFYAIKVQHPEDYEDGFKEANYLQELKKLKCPNIIYMYEYFTYNPINSKKPSVCMVFDLLVGSTYQLIKCGKYENGLGENIVSIIIKQISNALNIIKNNMNACHTDIKPENILIKGLDKRIQIFINKFLEEQFPEKFKIMCEKIIVDYKLKLSNQKHKKKFAKIKREVCQKIIYNINSKINFFIENTYNFKKDLKIIDVDENIQVVLADFGTIKPFNKIKYNDDIQTRYYRAPEIILMCPYDYKVDIWSLACTAYELLTGSLLFDPEKDKNYSTDFHHIYWIIELLGDIPKSLILKSKNASEFFNSNGKFRGTKPKIHPLSVIFNQDMEIDCSSKMIYLLEKMLAISPKDRFNYDEIINYIISNY